MVATERCVPLGRFWFLFVQLDVPVLLIVVDGFCKMAHLIHHDPFRRICCIVLVFTAFPIAIGNYMLLLNLICVYEGMHCGIQRPPPSTSFVYMRRPVSISVLNLSNRVFLNCETESWHTSCQLLYPSCPLGYCLPFTPRDNLLLV